MFTLLSAILMLIIMLASMAFSVLMFTWIWRTRPFNYYRSIPIVKIEDLFNDYH